jgi:hypothetical protein
MAKRMTMADVRRKNAAAGGYYFSRGTSKFFGREKFYGPYSGPGGVFFVKVGARPGVGVGIHEVLPSGHIGSAIDFTGDLDEKRAFARGLARGGSKARKRTR